MSAAFDISAATAILKQRYCEAVPLVEGTYAALCAQAEALRTRGALSVHMQQRLGVRYRMVKPLETWNTQPLFSLVTKAKSAWPWDASPAPVLEFEIIAATQRRRGSHYEGDAREAISADEAASRAHMGRLASAVDYAERALSKAREALYEAEARE